MLGLITGLRILRPLPVVLALLGVLALSGRADASGCHVAERPTFGMEAGRVGPPASPARGQQSGPAEPAHYRQAPCPGDPAGLPTRIDPPRSALAIAPGGDQPAPVGPRALESSDLALPPSRISPPERPPRPILAPPVAVI